VNARLANCHAAAWIALCMSVLAGCSRPSGAAAAGADRNAPVARVDGQVVTDGDLADGIKAPLAAAESRYAEEVWGIKRRALDALVEQRLLDTKARKEGITTDALVEREITRKVQEPAESALQTIYDQTKAGGRTLPPFPEVKAEIARFVKDQQAQQLRQAWVAKLRAEAKVEILLPPYLPAKADVKPDGPSKGDPKAPITIVEFSDYECTFCAQAEPTVKRILEAYPGKVRLVLETYPLSIHPNAPKASEAALCAGEQQRYWDMHDLLFANQNALKVDDLKGYARRLGLDAGRFDACLDSGRMGAAVESGRKAGDKLGINSTPTFFVDGRPFVGARTFETFQEVIDYTLAAKR
jgi:protein-disulfide isomerase